MSQAIHANIRKRVQSCIGEGLICTALRLPHVDKFARLHTQPITGHGDFSEEDHEAARRWLDNLDNKTIPQKLREVTYSRSSGPGGQNVNKCVLAWD